MSDYKCSECGASGCKLWRESHVFANEVALMCAPCAAGAEFEDISEIDQNGSIPWLHRQRTDQIGSMVPAVPTDDGSFWGYTSVPESGVAWWRALPSLPF